MTLLKDFCSQTHIQPCFHPLGVHTNPPPPVPSFLLTLNQSSKEIAGSSIDMNNFILHHYPSLTVQEVETSTEYEDGEKWWGITRSMISEVGDSGPVFIVHTKDSAFTTGS